MAGMDAALRERILREILNARRVVYRLHGATPLEGYALGDGLKLYVKREDMGPIHADKWPGAYNFIAGLNESERARGVVAASAGNHAQGVALAAARMLG